MCIAFKSIGVELCFSVLTWRLWIGEAPWTVDEEKQLRVLLQEKKGVLAIATALGKTRDSVTMKLARLEVEVVQGEKTMRSTSTCASWALPAELPSIEEELKVLAETLKLFLSLSMYHFLLKLLDTYLTLLVVRNRAQQSI
jgi:hypothetical protein